MEAINWKLVFSPKALGYTFFGAIFAVIALKGFMIPNHFLDGGVTGLSILAHEATHYNISYFLILFNLPFVFLGYKKMGITFAVQSLIAILVLAILMDFIEFEAFTSDKLLISIFGGFLIGLGIGLVIRGGGVIDGFEVIAHYTERKSAFSSGEIVLFINSIIFLLAALSFGIEAAMYSILTYFTAVKTSDYVVDGFEEYTALTVISKDYEIVKSVIVKDFHKALVVYKGERGYLPNSFDVKNDVDIIMTIVTRLEIHLIKQAISKVDPHAFFYVQRVKEVKGGLVKRHTHS